jgi:hypothetical protein
MKRLKISSIAVLALATGALVSAFNPPHHIGKKRTLKSGQIYYWWFDVHSMVGAVITPDPYPDPMIGGYQATKSDAINWNYPGCTDAASPACVGGYMLSQVNFDADGYAVSVKMSGNAYAQPVVTIVHSY